MKIFLVSNRTHLGSHTEVGRTLESSACDDLSNMSQGAVDHASEYINSYDLKYRVVMSSQSTHCNVMPVLVQRHNT